MTRTVEVSKLCFLCSLYLFATVFSTWDRLGMLIPPRPWTGQFRLAKLATTPQRRFFHHLLHTFSVILIHFLRFFSILFLLLTFPAWGCPPGTPVPEGQRCDVAMWTSHSFRKHREHNTAQDICLKTVYGVGHSFVISMRILFFVQCPFVLNNHNIMMRSWSCKCPRLYQESPRRVFDAFILWCETCRYGWPGQGVVQTRTSERRCRSARWMRRLAWPSGGRSDASFCQTFCQKICQKFGISFGANFEAHRMWPHASLRFVLKCRFSWSDMKCLWISHVSRVSNRFQLPLWDLFVLGHSEVAPDDDLCRLRWEPMRRHGFVSHFCWPGTTCLNAWMLDT